MDRWFRSFGLESLKLCLEGLIDGPVQWPATMALGAGALGLIALAWLAGAAWNVLTDTGAVETVLKLN